MVLKYVGFVAHFKLIIKSDFIYVKLHKTFFFWKNSRH
jgi:hypothetical protein